MSFVCVKVKSGLVVPFVGVAGIIAEILHDRKTACLAVAAMNREAGESKYKIEKI